MAIRAIVVDDAPLDREKVRQLSRGIPDLRIVDECATGKEALESIDTFAPDVVFLDIELPDVRGLDLLEEVELALRPGIVFITGHEKHAVDAFRLDVLDYLLKPVRVADFRRAVDRARELTMRRRQAANRVVVGASEPAKRSLRRLKVRQGNRTVFVSTDDVLWLTTDRNYVRLVTDGGQEYRIRGTLNEFEARLDPHQFLRIHRATLVNLDRVSEVRREKGASYSVLTDDGQVHPVSRTGRAALRRQH